MALVAAEETMISVLYMKEVWPSFKRSTNGKETLERFIHVSKHPAR